MIFERIIFIVQFWRFAPDFSVNVFRQVWLPSAFALINHITRSCVAEANATDFLKNSVFNYGLTKFTTPGVSGGSPAAVVKFRSNAQ
jgi:hypothetical protein